MKTQITIAVSTIFQNGGDATRALEIAEIIRRHKPSDCTLRIVFISFGSQYEQKVTDAGFELYRATPTMAGIRYQDDLLTRFGELIGTDTLAYNILQGEIEALRVIKPNLLLHGFWPIASIASRMCMPEVPRVAFLPIPLTEALLHENLTFPDELILSRLPVCFQKQIFHLLPLEWKKKNPALKHRQIRRAAERAGWKDAPLNNVFDMLRSDLVLVNDLPVFYHIENYPSHFIFTGPVYAGQRIQTAEVTDIFKMWDEDKEFKKIFCSLGTSGSKKELLEIIEMFNHLSAANYSGIVLSPPSVCPIEEVRCRLRNPHVFVTDRFVPAHELCKRADLVICHGGQGTLQTAIMADTPLIGVATQPEQKINLEHLEAYGAAIRIPMRLWNSKHLEHVVKTMFENHNRYVECVKKLRKAYQDIDTENVISTAIWRCLRMYGA